MKKIWILFIITMFVACTTPGERKHMLSMMEEAQRQNQAYKPFTSDSTGKRLVAFFDRHGNANEKMLAHYLLGCMYRDLGDAPQALQCYQDAVEEADTTNDGCNDTLLGRIHGQMADLYYEEFLPEKSLEESGIAERYAWKIKDTLSALINEEWQSKAYQQMGKKDAATAIRKKCLKYYRQYGYIRQAKMLLPLLIRSSVEEGNLEEAEQYMKDYDHAGTSQPPVMYNYIKGMFFVKSGLPDSAGYYFRKEHPRTLNDSLAISKGLHELFLVTHQKDSAIEYGNLYSDLLIRTFDESSTATMLKTEALYNYSRQQKIADKKTLEASRYRIYLTIMLFLFILITTMVILWITHSIFRKKKRIERITHEYQTVVQRLHQEKSELLNLTTEKYTNVIEEKENLITQLQEKVREMEKDNPYLLDQRLMSSEIYRRFKDSANGIDRESITSNDWKKLREWMDAAVPNLYHTINIKEHPITVAEYEFCILVRLHFNNSEIGHLCNLDSARVSTIRKRLLARIYKTNGSPKDFDERIARIC